MWVKVLIWQLDRVLRSKPDAELVIKFVRTIPE